MLDRHFRFVLLVLFLCGGPGAIAQESDDPGFRPIFDGQSLDGWDGDLDHWSVVDGAITGKSTKDKPLKSNTFLVWRAGQVADFELRLKIRIVGGNSGIQFRSQEDAEVKYRIGGYQADFDANNQWSGILYDERGRGVLATRGQQVTLAEDTKPQVTGQLDTEQAVVDSIKKEDWNDYRIRAVGNHLQLFINGVKSVDVTDDDPQNRDLSGLLALQLHAGPPMTVSFKDLRIKNLGQPGDKDGADDGSDKRKKIVFVAGKPSHGYGAHEHYAGSVLLAKRVEAALPSADVVVVRNGWPKNAAEVFTDADAVVMYADGGKNHPVIPHLAEMDAMMQQGVGLVCLHYGVEVPKGTAGEAFLAWIGGYFEMNWSVNPHWTADILTLPVHPITRGVKPFKAHDEWYFHMRFRDDMDGVTPILSTVPPEDTMSRSDGTHSGNPHVRKAVAEKQPQHLAWCAVRPAGGRGFGFTGGHFHEAWANDDLRQLVLNAIAWTAHIEVPEDGIPDENVTPAELEENQDFAKPAGVQ